MIRPALCFAIALTLTACGKREETAPVNPPATATPQERSAQPADAPAASARAVINPAQGNTAAGELTLTADSGFVRINGQLTGVAPNSEHGIHVHENGDCSAPDASSAGAHFNPTSQPHGNPDVPEHHTGDMHNVTADDKGNVQVDIRAIGATLRDGAPTDVAGKSIVVHAKPDDYKTQPSGDSGGRIACGVIE